MSETYHCSHHAIIVHTQIPCQLDSDPDTQRGRDEGACHKGPADGEEGPALALIPDGWRLEGVFFHGCRERTGCSKKKMQILL